MNHQAPAQRIKDFEKKQYLVSVLFLIIFCGTAVILNSLHLQSVAEENTRFLSRLIKIGDFRETVLVLQEARLSSFTSIQYQSKQAGRSFTLPPKSEVFKKESIWNKITTDSITVPVFNQLSSESPDLITYQYKRFRFLPYAFVIWLILNLVSIPQTRYMKRRLIEQFNQDLEIEKKLARGEVASQVRHNLRTPLAALMRIPKKLPDSVAKERELLELIIKQIRELIGKYEEAKENAFPMNSTTDIYNTLILSKKEIELSLPKGIQLHYEIEENLSSALIHHVPFELRSVLSNLVTNSIEAIEHEGKILVSAKDRGNSIEIQVTDTGCGIPSENLSKIFNQNFTYGKIRGSGIGLSHTKTQIESWGGAIHAESTLGIGTTMIVSLPIYDRAKWYLPKLKFNEQSRIFILDDQPSALELWRLQMEEAKLIDQTVFIDNPRRLEEYSKEFESSPEQYIFLFDYDLGEDNVNGLSLLKKLPEKSIRCLVTGHFDEEEVQAECIASGVYLTGKWKRMTCLNDERASTFYGRKGHSLGNFPSIHD